MALVSSNQYGENYKWGFEDADAPVIAGVKVHTADLRYEGEVFSQAQDGEGHTSSVVASKGAKRMITGSFTGYCTAEPGTTAEHFEFNSRFYIVKGVSVPKKKGEYWEVTIEAQSFANVTGVA